jgi:hypothetical protein
MAPAHAAISPERRPVEPDIEKMETQLENWGMTIEKLAARAERARGQTRTDLDYHVDDLKARRALALARLSEFRAAGDEEREDFMDSLESAWTDLETAFNTLGL